MSPAQVPAVKEDPGPIDIDIIFKASKMNQYQKVYMNQIHSSSLLGQLAQMWKSQMLCDALIRTGNVTTKAHRVVLVAACPMLQSMDNASVGSHLEVRLAADIKQEAVNSFLQYLYEGFMMLSEENCKDVEKVARLLQVDSVTKCCIDFYNCLQKKTGVPVYSNTQYKYSSADLLEFRHVRTTDLQKTLHERMMKRAAADSVRPTSPSGKRQRMQQQRPPSPNIDLAMFGQKADDTLSMTHSYMGNTGNQAAGEPWERVPRIGAIHSQRPSHPKPGVIEIVEDSLEILQTQPPDKDGNKSAPPIIQKSMAISVSSQVNSSQDVHVVNVNDSSSHPTAAGDGPIMSTGRDSITVSPLTVMPGTSSLSSSSASSPLTKDPHKSTMDKDMSDKHIYAKKLQSSLDHQSSTPQRGLFPVSMSPANMSPINQVKKSFAAGSASQAASMSQSHDSPAKRTSTSAGNEIERPQSSDQGKDLGTKNKVDDRSASNSTDMAPDLSIVKVEPTGEAGLDMYVDVPEESMMQAQQREQREHDDESDLELEEASGDWSRDEMSNEAAGGDQNNSWYIGQFKDDMSSLQSTVFMGQNFDYTVAQNLEQLHPTSIDSKTDNTKSVVCFNYDEILLKGRDDPFSDIPREHYISLTTLIDLHKQSLGPGNFAKNVSEKLFPELFGPDLLRIYYSYNGGGRCDKKELDPFRKAYLKKYVTFFHPELESTHLWKESAVSKINENLRRPTKQKRV
ncbi:unnamed protein product [Mytilus edulis]|uniref:BTB domain-containing protein n=1 Tax=Mytilus edulis TaxID=6550 RepID=A0A8S3UY68_MYTED|nr:unnamed protein product [Mytilus edulis]